MTPKLTSTGFMVILAIMVVVLLIAITSIERRSQRQLKEAVEQRKEYRDEVRGDLDAIRKKLGIPDNP